MKDYLKRLEENGFLKKEETGIEQVKALPDSALEISQPLRKTST